MGRERPVPFPVKIVVAARARVVIRRGHDGPGALDVDVGQEEAADLGLLVLAEGLALRLVGELALRAGRRRRGRATLRVEAPGSGVRRAPAAALRLAVALRRAQDAAVLASRSSHVAGVAGQRHPSNSCYAEHAREDHAWRCTSWPM